MKKIGNLLVEYSLVSSSQLLKALELQKTTGLRIGDQLKALDAITQDEINWVVTKQYKIPYIILTTDIVDRNVFEHFPYPVLLQNDIVPVREEEGVYYFALPDPSEEETVQVISGLTKGRYSLVLAELCGIQKILQEMFSYFPYPINLLPVQKYKDMDQIVFKSVPEEFIFFLSGYSLSANMNELAVFSENRRLFITDMLGKDIKYKGQLPTCWDSLKESLSRSILQPFFTVLKGKRYVTILHSLDNERCSGFILKNEQIGLLDRDVFLSYNNILQKYMDIKNRPLVWVFSLSFFNSLACFHIVYKMFFRHAVIINRLQYRPIPIPYLFPLEKKSAFFQSLSVLTDSAKEWEKFVSIGNGNIFLVNHEQQFDLKRIPRPVLHVYEDDRKNIKVELIE